MPRTAEENQRIRDEQRTRILTAARLVFARKGLAATVDDVAAEAGVSHGLAYRYFSNKEALFVELVAQDLQSSAAFFEPTSPDLDASQANLKPSDLPDTPGRRLRLAITGFVESRRDHPEAYLLLDQALSGEHTPPGLRQMIQQRGRTVQVLLKQWIIEGQASGEVASGSPDELVRALLACFDGLTRWAANHPEQYHEHFPSPEIFLRLLGFTDQLKETKKMTTTQTSTLHVPGASLAYQVRGSGPVLLLIAGGDGGGEGYLNLANALAEHYTVITYDRRGAVGSVLEDPTAEVSIETHAGDAHRLLEAITAELEDQSGPSYVFGSSAGALIGLDLAIRYPQQVHVLVAHEPPVEGLLPDFDRSQNEMLAVYQQAGGAAAMMKFMASLGMRYDDLEPGLVLPHRGPQDLGQRGDALMNYTFKAVHRYRLDLSALAQTPVKVVLAAGKDGTESPVYHCTAALAERLGSPLVEFPSHHAGYVSHPRAFAARLQEILSVY